MFNKYFEFKKEKFSNSKDFLALKGNLAIKGHLNATNINLEQTSSINFGKHQLSINKDGHLTINGKKVSFMGVPSITKMSGIINKKKTNVVKIPAPVKTIASVVKKPVPVVKKPVPTVKKPVPVVKKSAPTVKKPVPVKISTSVKKLASFFKKSAPTVKKPVPVVKKPAPTVKKPVPVVKKPVPVVKKPVPVKISTSVKKPASVVKIPAPIKISTSVKKLASVFKKQAPNVKKATPVVKKPVPVVKKPVPVKISTSVKKPASVVKIPAPIKISTSVKKLASVFKKQAPNVKKATPVVKRIVRQSSNTFNLDQVKNFNNRARSLALPFYVEFTSKQSAPYNRVIYKRLTPVKDWNFYRLLHYDWFSNKPIEGKPINNIMNVDFQLFSSLSDAKKNLKPWKFCNFDDSGVGFPRDCGVNSAFGGNWVSYYPGKKSKRKIDFNFRFLPTTGATNSIKYNNSTIKTATASNIEQPIFPASNTINNKVGSTMDCWIPTHRNRWNTNTFTGTEFTIVDGKNYVADWIDYEFNKPVSLENFTIFGRSQTDARWLPSEFKLLASHDGKNYKVINSYSNLQTTDYSSADTLDQYKSAIAPRTTLITKWNAENSPGNQGRNFFKFFDNLNTNKKQYKYYRFAIKKITTGGALSISEIEMNLRTGFYDNSNVTRKTVATTEKFTNTSSIGMYTISGQYIKF